MALGALGAESPGSSSAALHGLGRSRLVELCPLALVFLAREGLWRSWVLCRCEAAFQQCLLSL